MQLFITGATGHIGFGVATAFRRAGWKVWGLTRSQKKATWLARNEVHPVIGSLQEPDAFTGIAAKSDVIIHAGVDYEADTAALDKATVQSLLSVARKSSDSKRIIYTSGTWVLGASNGQPLTEQSPPAPIQSVAWRPEVEQMVLDAAGVGGVVIRPGVVYGRSGGMTGAWFEGAAKGDALQVVGDGHNHWAMIHVDDLAQGYLQAAESRVSGEVFNLVDASRDAVLDMVGAAARVAGHTPQLEFAPADEAIQDMGVLAEALALDQVVDAAKARRILNWRPKHQGFVADVDTYFKAWQASQQNEFYGGCHP